MLYHLLIRCLGAVFRSAQALASAFVYLGTLKIAIAKNEHNPNPMDSLEITCPHCWETITIEAPVAQAQAVEFTCDCEVCCRPIAVRLSWPDGIDLPPEIVAESES